jgi:hypothetical protein
MDYIQLDGGRGNRQVKPRRQDYPLWGIEDPRREWNGHSLYRGGQRDPLMRYIIAPSDRAKVLNMGFTVLDALLSIAVAAFMLLMIHAVGVGIDGYLDLYGM